MRYLSRLMQSEKLFGWVLVAGLLASSCGILYSNFQASLEQAKTVPGVSCPLCGREITIDDQALRCLTSICSYPRKD